jgi:3D (Asp-Asp-Asp) domain-containing protein
MRRRLVGGALGLATLLILAASSALPLVNGPVGASAANTGRSYQGGESADFCERNLADDEVVLARVRGTGTAGLRVREGPHATARSQLVLHEGALVAVIGQPGDTNPSQWREITDPHGTRFRGWSNSEYLSLLGACNSAPDRGREDAPIRGKVLSARVTAYSYQEPGQGAHGWITRSGEPVAWGMVAVDPAVIPIGSRLSIEGFSETFVALDTGFGVRGAHVDVFFPTEAAAREFGVKQREVLVLTEH